jgi:hypothetical protein
MPNTVWLGTAMQVESWIMERGTEWMGKSWDELKYIRQVCMHGPTVMGLNST